MNIDDYICPMCQTDNFKVDNLMTGAFTTTILCWKCCTVFEIAVPPRSEEDLDG